MKRFFRQRGFELRGFNFSIVCANTLCHGRAEPAAVMGLSSLPSDKAPVVGSPNRDLPSPCPRERCDADNLKTHVLLCLFTE